MLNQKNILETIEMIDKQHLDIRTITMGISLGTAPIRMPRPAAGKFTTRSAPGRRTW